MLIAITIVSVVIHELAHSFVARRYGCTNEKLNPLNHLDLWGSLVVPAAALVLGIVWIPFWAKSANLDIPALITQGKQKEVVKIYAAGPLSNLALALAAVIVSLVSLAVDPMSFIYEISFTFFLVNMALGLFNMLPLRPLDGYYILNFHIEGTRLSVFTQQLGVSAAIASIFGFSILFGSEWIAWALPW
jgi:Zn-dependent protease